MSSLTLFVLCTPAGCPSPSLVQVLASETGEAFVLYVEHESLSISRAFYAIEGPIPSREIEEMSLTFSSQFLGALPKALSPLGALALMGIMRTLMEDSSTKTKHRGSTPP
jgi:hypothetical protein